MNFNSIDIVWGNENIGDNLQLTDVTLASQNSAKFTGKHLSRSSFFGKIADIGKPDTSGLIPLIKNRDHSFCTFSKNFSKN